ncbi:MAG: ABC transporter permease [Victivallaceae bacterium]|nr:ABC transporter permease [Victivallaceae bacterium]
MNHDNSEQPSASGSRAAFKRFAGDILAVSGLIGVAILLIIAIVAPLLANRRPLILYSDALFSFPFLRYIFAPDSPEKFVEATFNYLLIFIPFAIVITFALRKFATIRNFMLLTGALLLIIPFITVSPKLDTGTDWRQHCSKLKTGEFAVFAPIHYGPFEQTAKPYEYPSARHYLGTDQIGRDVLARMIYGARVSLAVGIFATALALIIGTSVGLASGYFRGKTDLITMRIVEIVICFPTFLLLLILMSMLSDYKFNQSILVVIAVIGLTGWTGLCRLVRGEVLKQRILPYIQSCEALGLPTWRIMLFHLLPNISGPILVAFTFGVAGAIIAESGLSFLGFGVQPPTASWGELLRQAFADPFAYRHLTFCPGIALFLSVCAFNFTGEGLRKFFDPKS